MWLFFFVLPRNGSDLFPMANSPEEEFWMWETHTHSLKHTQAAFEISSTPFSLAAFESIIIQQNSVPQYLFQHTHAHTHTLWVQKHLLLLFTWLSPKLTLDQMLVKNSKHAVLHDENVMFSLQLPASMTQMFRLNSFPTCYVHIKEMLLVHSAFDVKPRDVCSGLNCNALKHSLCISQQQLDLYRRHIVCVFMSLILLPQLSRVEIVRWDIHDKGTLGSRSVSGVCLGRVLLLHLEGNQIHRKGKYYIGY